MAELAAIELASNVLQFIDFPIKLFVRARRIDKSANGTAQELEDLQASVSTLEQTAKSLKINLQQFPFASNMTPNERALMKTVSDCDKYAKVLVGQLEKTKVTSKSRIIRGLNSIKVALWLGYELEDNQRKLEDLQEQLLLQLAETMK